MSPHQIDDSAMLTVAVPKGRILKPLCKLLETAGISPEVLRRDDRTLVREDPESGLRYLLLKPDDVPTYVEYGAADLGIVGRDVLFERQYDLYSPLDLEIGRCTMQVAGVPEAKHLATDATHPNLRIATKFPNIATQYFRERGRSVEVIFVQGSVELAPLTGLADLIVDLVESGETLRQNGLVEFDKVCDVSTLVIANRAALKLKRAKIKPLLAALKTAVSLSR